MARSSISPMGRRTKRTARAAGNFVNAGLIRRDLQHGGSALDDLFHRTVIVIIQPINRAKACAQRGRDQSQSRRCTDNREMRQLQTNGARRRSLADDDIQRKIFHGRIQHFFDRTPQTMNLINKEYIARAQIGQDCSQVTGAFDGRT